MEIYKDIPNYEGYKLSNLDNVKSRKRGFEKVLKGYRTPKGYLNYSLYKDGKLSTLSLHVIKAMVYMDFVPCGLKLIVDHIDEDKSNNDLSNLQIITNRQNMGKYFKTIPTSSKYTGVSWDKNSGKWSSQITIGNKLKHLGLYFNESNANLAYQYALKEL